MLILPILLAILAPPGSEGCRDDRGVDRCAAEQQARTRELYGVKSIEEHAKAGDQVRRVFYVDGYGRDLLAISFLRASGEEPTVFVHFPRRAEEPVRPPLRAAVPHAVWTDVLRLSELFDRRLAPKAKEVPEICLHSWVYTVEANDPKRANLSPASLRRATEDACADGLVEAFAREAEKAALPLFPHCDRLDPKLHRNPATQLFNCRILAGDRMAAAEVLNSAEKIRRARTSEDRDDLGGLFAHRTIIDWQGERIVADSFRAPAIWTSRLEQSGNVALYVHGVTGLAADRAKLTGRLFRRVEPSVNGRPADYVAPVEMTWVFGPSQDWEITEVAVASWDRYLPPTAR